MLGERQDHHGRCFVMSLISYVGQRGWGALRGFGDFSPYAATTTARWQASGPDYLSRLEM